MTGRMGVKGWRMSGMISGMNIKTPKSPEENKKNKEKIARKHSKITPTKHKLTDALKGKS